LDEEMKIKFYYSKFEGNLGCEIGECDKPIAGYLEFTESDLIQSISIYVCENHKNSIKEDNPLLIPYLKLVDACC
jgi:hypothetical protein